MAVGRTNSQIPVSGEGLPPLEAGVFNIFPQKTKPSQSVGIWIKSDEVTGIRIESGIEPDEYSTVYPNAVYTGTAISLDNGSYCAEYDGNILVHRAASGAQFQLYKPDGTQIYARIHQTSTFNPGAASNWSSALAGEYYYALFDTSTTEKSALGTCQRMPVPKDGTGLLSGVTTMSLTNAGAIANDGTMVPVGSDAYYFNGSGTTSKIVIIPSTGTAVSMINAPFGTNHGPSSFYGCGACVHGDDIWMFGGATVAFAGTTTTYKSDVRKINIATHEATVLGWTLPSNFLGAAGSDGRYIYLTPRVTIGEFTIGHMYRVDVTSGTVVNIGRKVPIGQVTAAKYYMHNMPTFSRENSIMLPFTVDSSTPTKFTGLTYDYPLGTAVVVLDNQYQSKPLLLTRNGWKFQPSVKTVLMQTLNGLKPVAWAHWSGTAWVNIEP